jgi:lipopolysaccharide export system permease protein
MRSRTLSPGPVASRYLTREFLSFFLPILAAFILLYLVIDFFERLDILMKNQASASATVRYFLFKVPLMVTQILPPAVLSSLLLALGNLARRNEIVALRASGISLGQTAIPLLGMATLLSLGGLAWNEMLVPYCTRQYQYINNVEIRKRTPRSLLSDRGIWYHGAGGFYNIDHVDTQKSTLFGLTIYRTTTGLQLRSIVEAESAHWTIAGWTLTGAIERTVDSKDEIHQQPLPSTEEVIPESFADFLEVHHDPEELSYLALRQRIDQLMAKGIDPSNYTVALNLKLSLPFASLVLACVAIPLGGRVQRHASVAAILGSGIALGFGYWVLLALSNSLGQSGTLHPWIAAWTANAVFGLVGVVLFLHYE